MKPADPHSVWRNRSWNRLQFQCPPHWEVIVAGARQLLFEENFRPVLELKWQPPAKNISERAAILDRIKKENGLFPQKNISLSWAEVSDRFQLTLLTDQKDTAAKAALLFCKQCCTTILAHGFQETSSKEADIAKLLATIICHHHENSDNRWAIQDFSMLLPPDYLLTGYSFAPGLTRLSFAAGSLTCHVCRLATAAARLQSSTLTDLLMLLGDIQVDDNLIMKTAYSAYHSSSKPALHRQMLLRMKRKPPFHEITLRHHPEHDRLSGLFIFDKKPIDKEIYQQILASYENIP